MLFGGAYDDEALADLWVLWNDLDVDGALDSLEFGGSDDGPGDMLNGETDADYYLTFLSDLIKVSTEKKAPNSFRSMP